MRSLTTALSPAEVAEALDIPLELVDALINSGRVLCQMERGQPRIPLAQLEAFFREALMCVYAVESARVAPAEPEPVADLVAGCELRVACEESLEAPVPQVEAAHATRNPQLATPLELRRTPRFIPIRHISGIFDEAKFTIVQISSTGLRIRHNEPLLPGTEAKLSFALLKPARSFVMRARVVWTSVAKSGDERFAISGLRVIEHGDRLNRAVEILRAAHELQPERRVQHRRADDVTLPAASDEEIALVTTAMQKFANDPVEAGRWYSRARFAVSDENVRRAAPQSPRERDEVLGLWEYLDRQVDIEKIAGVVALQRGAN